MFKQAGIFLVVSFFCMAATAMAVTPQPQESRAIELTGGGKVLVAGNATDGVFVARYLRDGSVDPSFGGGDGVTVIAGRGSLGGLGVQSDGRIVIASNYLSEAEPSSLTRLTASGQVDETFGTDGTEVITSGFTSGGTGNGLSIDSSDRILVAGTTYPSGTPATATARFLSDGHPDDGFGTGGVAVIDQGGDYLTQETATSTIARGADVFSTGALRVGPNPGRFFFAKFDSTGLADPSFGNGGIGWGSGSNLSEARDMAIKRNGSLLSVGSAPVRYGCPKVVVSKVDAQGQPDSTYGSGGVAVASPPDCEIATAIALTEGGKALVTGPVPYPRPSAKKKPRIVVTKFRGSGSADTAFGSRGMVAHRLKQGPSGTSSLAVTPSGSILAAGWFEPGGRTPLLIKLKANGSTQKAFGRDGVGKRLRDTTP